MDQLVKFVLTFVALISVASTFGVASPLGNATQADDASSCQEKKWSDLYDKWQKLKLLGKKYLISPTKKSITWKGAKEKCEEKGGTLATNLSPEWFKEAVKLKGQCFSRYNSYWVGAVLDGSYEDNKWKWITGESLPLKNPNWKKGFPHFVAPGFSDEYCVQIFDKYSDALENNYCFIKNAYVCELY